MDINFQKIKSFLKSILSDKKFYFVIIVWLTFFSLFLYNISLLHFSISLKILSIIIFALIFFYLIQHKKNVQIEEIKSVINGIKLNKYDSVDSIKLSSGLKELQDEICAMFIKMQDDINYLKKLEKMRTEFLANVSHELRTPIFKIQGYIETLLNGAINDEKVNLNFLNKSNNSIIHLSNLLNDLIDISMIESGEMQMSFRYFELDEYLEQIKNNFIESAQQKNIELIYKSCSKELKVFGDKEKLRVVLNNLIQNAIKYTDEGSVEMIIEENKKDINLIIRDTGNGISNNEINRIFERFYRTKIARDNTISGTGLGLAIVKHIIEAHNSAVVVKSRIGKGTDFSFKLDKI